MANIFLLILNFYINIWICAHTHVCMLDCWLADDDDDYDADADDVNVMIMLMMMMMLHTQTHLRINFRNIVD